jgi:N-acetylglucosamine malate deacetylase 1
VALYGAERGLKIRYAEAFELSQYGRQVKIDELKQMFPK